MNNFLVHGQAGVTRKNLGAGAVAPAGTGDARLLHQLPSSFIQVQSRNPRFHHSAQFVQHGGRSPTGLAHFFLLLKSFADHGIG